MVQRLAMAIVVLAIVTGSNEADFDAAPPANWTYQADHRLALRDVVLAAVTAADDPPQCEPAENRSCTAQCNGVYGMNCQDGEVCDPALHRCVKPYVGWVGDLPAEKGPVDIPAF